MSAAGDDLPDWERWVKRLCPTCGAWEHDPWDCPVLDAFVRGTIRD